MILLAYITMSCLLSPALTHPAEPACGSNHTKILLLVNTRSDTNLTITRLKNIVSYFVTKVKGGAIKTLDVCLVDPFQEKTLFNLTKVNSSREIMSAIDQVIESNVSVHESDDFLDTRPLVRASRHSKYRIDEMVEGIEYKDHLVIFLSQCYRKCHISLSLLQHYLWELPDILMLVLLYSPSEVRAKIYNRYYQRHFGTEKQLYLVVDNNDEFVRYNPVTLYGCRDCPAGWKRYIGTEHNRLSCYFVETLNKSLSWNQASNHCQSINSTLPVLETEDELKFLIKCLSETGARHRSDFNVSARTGKTTEVAFVGLLKKYAPKSKSFVWSNLRPFDLDSNLTKMADSKKDCVALNLTLRTTRGEKFIKWTLVKCDTAWSKILLCEMDVNLVPNLTGLKAQLKTKEQSGNPWRSKIIPTERHPETYIRVTHDERWSMFDCKTNDEMITYGSVCDGVRDCGTGRDEEYCQTMSAMNRQSKFFCVNPNSAGAHPTRVWVHLEETCNNQQDCPDNSDELDCDGCLSRHCRDGTCVPSHWLSGDLQTCFLFIGANRTVYLNVSYSCQGQCSGLIQFHQEIVFCNRSINWDQYSEGRTFYNNRTSGLEWSPKCLYLRGKGGIPTGCDDQYYLRDCSTFQCPEGFIKCPHSYCVPVYNFGDDVFDCPFGEDEDLKIDLKDVNDMFHCRASDAYVHQVHICDGVPQCPIADDETDCNVTCPPGFRCHGDAVGVTDYLQVIEIKSLNIFDVKTKFLNITGIDLSKLEKPFIFPNLLEIHASNCNLTDLEIVFNKYVNLYIYMADFGYNKFNILLNYGPLYSLTNLQFLSLSNNKDLTEVERHSIWSPKLHTLDLSFTAVSVLDLFIFKKSKSMRSLNLRHTNIANILPLIQIKRLEFLNLEKTSPSEENMIQILKSVNVASALYVDNYKFCCPQILTGGTPRHACHAPPEVFSSCEDLMNDSFKRSLLWLVAVVALAGNIVVIIYRLFYERGVFKKVYGIFVTNLSVSDFVMGLYLLIIASTDVHYRGDYVLHESVWRYSALCQTAGFLSTLSSETSTFFVFLITLDRCLVVRFPYGDHRFTKLGLGLSVLNAWILGFLLAAVPLMYPEWTIYSSNAMCLGLPLAGGGDVGWHYSFGLFICFNFILFLCVAYGQIFIFRLIFSSQRIEMTTTQSVARRAQDINVAKQLFLVVLSNFLCWFPICVLGFLSLTGYNVSPDTYAWLVVFVLPLNAAINPMIYTIPIMYSKWQDFKKGGKTGTPRRVNRSATVETKL